MATTPFDAYWQAKTEIERQLLDLEARYGAQAVDLQNKLYKWMDGNLLTRLEWTKDGKMANTTRNWTLVRTTNNAWYEYSQKYLNPTFMGYADDLIGITLLSSNSFKKILPSGEQTVKLLGRARDLVMQQMGVEALEGGKLKFLPGGYLDKLVRGVEVEDQIKGLLRENMTVSSDFKDFYRAFDNLIHGNDQVNGAMQKYFRTYVYDTFSGVHASYDNYVAEEAGLQHFIYAGTVIADSRPFCVQHCNKVYEKRYLARWDKQEWKGKRPGVPVVIARGGYNCRHQINWVTEDIAAVLKDGDVGKPPVVVKPEPKAKPAKATKVQKTPVVAGKTLWDKINLNRGEKVEYLGVDFSQKKSEIIAQFEERLDALGLSYDRDSLVQGLDGYGQRSTQHILNGILEGVTRMQRFGDIKTKKLTFYGDNPGADGYYSPWVTGRKAHEVDISLAGKNVRVSNEKNPAWKSYKGKNVGNTYYHISGMGDNHFRDVTMHEIGHAMTLFDFADPLSTQYNWLSVKAGRETSIGKMLKVLANHYMDAAWFKRAEAYSVEWYNQPRSPFVKQILDKAADQTDDMGWHFSDYGRKDAFEFFTEALSGLDHGMEYTPKLMKALKECFSLL